MEKKENTYDLIIIGGGAAAFAAANTANRLKKRTLMEQIRRSERILHPKKNSYARGLCNLNEWEKISHKEQQRLDDLKIQLEKLT